ncbi:MAG: hypothetical protein WC013_10015, partial [Aeromonas bestiarum]
MRQRERVQPQPIGNSPAGDSQVANPPQTGEKTMNQLSHQIQLLRRPVGMPSLADFTLVEVA